jgi:hypothetical protein
MPQIIQLNQLPDGSWLAPSMGRASLRLDELLAEVRREKPEAVVKATAPAR